MPVIYTPRAEAELIRLSQETQAEVRMAVAAAVRQRRREGRRQGRPLSEIARTLRLAVAGVRVYGYWWLGDTLVVVTVEAGPEPGT